MKTRHLALFVVLLVILVGCHFAGILDDIIAWGNWIAHALFNLIGL